MAAKKPPRRHKRGTSSQQGPGRAVRAASRRRRGATSLPDTTAEEAVNSNANRELHTVTVSHPVGIEVTSSKALQLRRTITQKRHDEHL